MKHFAINYDRVPQVVDVEFYQAGLSPIVEQAKDDPWLTDNDELPSWQKFAEDPARASGFWTMMLQSVFQGRHNVNELNMMFQTRRPARPNESRVAMMFLYSKTRTENMDIACELAQQALPGYVVKVINGKYTSNADAEQDAAEVIEKAQAEGKNVLFLSAGMAQRSFSIPEITELYLAYDNGDNGATVQKMSRTLTPWYMGKVGYVISLSFDPNRDDKFFEMMYESARNYQKTHNKKSLKEAWADVISTMNIFECTREGQLPVNPDTYLQRAMERKDISRVAGKTADVFALSGDEIKALAKGNSDYFRAGKTEKADKGRTRNKKPPKASVQSEKKPTDTDIQKAREVIISIVENMDVIIFGTGASTLADAFEQIDTNDEWQQVIYEEFGVKYHVIKHLFETGVINTDIVQLMYDNVEIAA